MPLARVWALDSVARAAGTTRDLVASEVGNNSAVPGATVADALTNLATSVPSSRTISTTAPLTGGGDLSANRTLALAAGTDTLRVLMWNPTSGFWENSTLRERVLDNTYSPVGNWGFNLQTLDDSSGNGFTLATDTAVTPRYAYITPTLGGVLLDGTYGLVRSADTPALRITGDVSIIGLCIMIDKPPASVTTVLCGHGTGGTAVEADNFVYGLQIQATAAAANLGVNIISISESGAGVSANHTISSWTAIGQLCMFGLSRTSNVYQHYLNGRTWGAPSAALTTPTGSTAARFRVGYNGAGAPTYQPLVVTSLAIYPSGLSAAQHLERFNFCLGRGSGFIE